MRKVGANVYRVLTLTVTAQWLQPAEDLVLEGTHKSLLRVRANTPYRSVPAAAMRGQVRRLRSLSCCMCSYVLISCIMLKTQRFASLFRHYAKHHGRASAQHQEHHTEACRTCVMSQPSLVRS